MASVSSSGFQLEQYVAAARSHKGIGQMQHQALTASLHHAIKPALQLNAISHTGLFDHL